MQTAVKDDLSVNSNYDNFYTLVYIKRIINRMLKLVAGLHPFPHTERALLRSTEANQEWYNNPEDFKTDSIFRLEIDGDSYIPLNWQDYQKYKTDYGESATKKYFTTFRNKYFISPTPTADGGNNISIWGQEVPEDMVDDSDVSPFEGEPILEEEVVELAIATCLMKGRGANYSRGVERKNNAITYIESIYDTINRRQALTRTQNTSMFKWQPTLPKNGSTRNGSFNRC